MYTPRGVFCTFAFVMVVTASNQLYSLSDAFIELINKEGKWIAGRNFHPDTPIEYIKQLLGENDIMRYSDYKHTPVVEHDAELIKNLPESFDSRDKWPNCPSMYEIRDQGRCGACWAFGAVEAMTDRVCTYSNGTKNFHFSAEDVVTCMSVDAHGCFGGDSITVWEEWTKGGYVSGGNYNSHQGCKPYSIPTCLHHMLNCTDYMPTPSCLHSCDESYNKTFKADKRRGKNSYFIIGEDNMKAELYKNGPIEAFFLVYEDFANYKGGVYQHLLGEPLGRHAVKLLGWGVENGTKYWHLANSWNTDFGENGFFKIVRGVNECFIEMHATAGEPLMEDYD